MKFFALKHFGVFRVSGRDARRYLNSRLSADIRALQPMRSCLAAMLSPQGRTEGFFSVLAISDEEFLLVSDAPGPEAEASLKRFLAADRVVVTEETASWIVLHLSEAPSSDLQQNVPMFSLASSRTGTGTIDLIVPVVSAGEIRSQLSALGWVEMAEAEFQYLRRASGRPAFPIEINSESLFYESGLRSAVSFKKGCYVGQEVNERIDSHGKTARRLMRIKTVGPLTDGEEAAITTSGIQIKLKIISAASYGGRTAAFLQVKNDAVLEAGPVVISGQTAEILPIEVD